MACATVFVREEERERKGERRWAFVPGDCFRGGGTVGDCALLSQQRTGVLLLLCCSRLPPTHARWFVLSPLFCPHLVAAGLAPAL